LLVGDVLQLVQQLLVGVLRECHTAAAAAAAAAPDEVGFMLLDIWVDSYCHTRCTHLQQASLPEPMPLRATSDENKHRCKRDVRVLLTALFLTLLRVDTKMQK
jgi:hypothetical protein